jgi:sugar/nucleoside kinase (ribokinase family)
LYEGTSLRFRAKPFGVEVRDTTGAGDIMLAIFAASLAEGEDERDSLRRAVAAATIAVEKVGIRKAILDRKQVEDDSKKIDVLDY